MVTGIAFSAISLSNTSGALNWMPSWLTYTHAGVVPSYCFGTYTQKSRVVPGKTLLLAKVCLVTSPFGTASCDCVAVGRARAAARNASAASGRRMGGNPWGRDSACGCMGARGRGKAEEVLANGPA